MIKQEIRKPKIQKRHKSIRVKLAGTAEFPRLAVYRSTKHIYAQLIDDEKHVTVCSASSVDKDLKENDIIIMCSDGIIDSNQVQTGDKWFLKLIKEINTNNVKKMADIILNEAIDNGYGILKDDMSVIVAKVVKL